MRTLEYKEPQMRGADVDAWKQFLAKQGYSVGVLRGGTFGPKTRDATSAFQRAVGLEGRGMVGPRTQREAERRGFRFAGDGAPTEGGAQETTPSLPQQDDGTDRGPLNFDREAFFTQYDALRSQSPIVFGRLSGSRRAALGQLLYSIDRDQLVTDLRWAAYMLATVRYECGASFLPVEEGGRGAGREYGERDPQTGHVYYGRGYVQLTWKENYASMGRILGVNLVNNPALVLQQVTAYRIMSHGMRHGSFRRDRRADGGRTHSLSRYIAGDRCDYYGARAIINGFNRRQGQLDKGREIAACARLFEQMLRGASR